MDYSPPDDEMQAVESYRYLMRLRHVECPLARIGAR